MPNVTRHDGVSKLERAGTDQQVVEGDGDAILGAFRIDLPNQFSCLCRNRVNRYGCLQIIKECAARLPPIDCIGAVPTPLR